MNLDKNNPIVQMVLNNLKKFGKQLKENKNTSDNILYVAMKALKLLDSWSVTSKHINMNSINKIMGECHIYKISDGYQDQFANYRHQILTYQGKGLKYFVFHNHVIRPLKQDDVSMFLTKVESLISDKVQHKSEGTTSEAGDSDNPLSTSSEESANQSSSASDSGFNLSKLLNHVVNSSTSSDSDESYGTNFNVSNDEPTGSYSDFSFGTSKESSSNAGAIHISTPNDSEKPAVVHKSNNYTKFPSENKSVNASDSTDADDLTSESVSTLDIKSELKALSDIEFKLSEHTMDPVAAVSKIQSPENPDVLKGFPKINSSDLAGYTASANGALKLVGKVRKFLFNRLSNASSKKASENKEKQSKKFVLNWIKGHSWSQAEDKLN